MPNVLTDFAKTSVCASSSAPPGHSARRGTVGGRCRPRARRGGHARHHRPRGLRRSTSTPRRYRSSGRETGRHHRVWREARPPLCRCARDHGAPRGVTGLTPGVTAWTVETIAALPPGERQTIAALVTEAGARSARAHALPTAITSTVRAPEKKKDLRPKCSCFCFFLVSVPGSREPIARAVRVPRIATARTYAHDTIQN